MTETATETSQIEAFFDELRKEFILPHMLKYINMASLRTAFVDKTVAALVDLRAARTEDVDLDDLLVDFSYVIPFSFNVSKSGSFEAQEKIEQFLREMINN